MTWFPYEKAVSSFPIGNGQTGLHFSSYEIQPERGLRAGCSRKILLLWSSIQSLRQYFGAASKVVSQSIAFASKVVSKLPSNALTLLM